MISLDIPKIAKRAMLPLRNHEVGVYQLGDPRPEARRLIALLRLGHAPRVEGRFQHIRRQNLLLFAELANRLAGLERLFRERRGAHSQCGGSDSYTWPDSSRRWPRRLRRWPPSPRRIEVDKRVRWPVLADGCFPGSCAPITGIMMLSSNWPPVALRRRPPSDRCRSPGHRPASCFRTSPG